MLMASGYVRERNGFFYVRTKVRVIDPQTGETRWRHVERAAGRNRRKAFDMARDLREEVQDGRFVPCGTSVLELGQLWLAEHVQPNLKPGAAANYRGTFYKHVAPGLGRLRVDDCGPAQIGAFLAKLRAQGLSEEGVGKIRRHLHAMFAFAQDAGLVAVNPAGVTRTRGRRAAPRRARGTQLSPVQIKLFLDECSPSWRSFFTVALDTGLRRGELIGLRWGDVDLLERTICVRRSIGPYDERRHPDSEPAPGAQPEAHDGEPQAHEDPLSTKTDAGRRLVPILDGAQAALEELYADASDTRDVAPVFATTVERQRGRDGRRPRAGRPLSPRTVSSVFRRYADRAGLPSTIRLHDLRHTAITGVIGQGEDILLVSAFAGHAQTSTTVDVYGHLMPERVREAARRMHSVAGAGPREGDSGEDGPGEGGPGESLLPRADDEA